MTPREIADALYGAIFHPGEYYEHERDAIERAIIAAESRGRAAMREEAAKVALAAMERLSTDYRHELWDSILALPTEPGAPEAEKPCDCGESFCPDFDKPAPAAQAEEDDDALPNVKFDISPPGRVAKLERVAEAARAVYENDDVFTVRRDADGRVERDNELGEALDALDQDAAGGEKP